MPKLINRNLIIAKELLRRANRGDKVDVHSLKSLQGEEEGWQALIRLEKRGAIAFKSEEDRFCYLKKKN